MSSWFASLARFWNAVRPRWDGYRFALYKDDLSPEAQRILRDDRPNMTFEEYMAWRAQQEKDAKDN